MIIKLQLQPGARLVALFSSEVLNIFEYQKPFLYNIMYSQNNERDENQIINAEKMPLFLVKLWNIVEDTAYSNIIRWDEVYN